MPSKGKQSRSRQLPLSFSSPLWIQRIQRFDQQSVPRKNQFQAPAEAHGKTRSKRALLGRFKEPLNPDLGAISSHPWGQHKQGFLCFLIKFWTFSLHSTPKTCHQYSKLEWQHHPAHLFLIKCEMSTSATLDSVLLLHLDWAPRLTQGPEGPSNGKTGAWQCKSVRALFERWIPKCWGFEGEIPTQRNCVTSLNLLVSRRCSI